MSYKYEDARYTNWDKIPIILPAIKKVLDWRLGIKKADHVSLRIFMMRKFNVFFICALVLQSILLVYVIVLIRKKNKLFKVSFTQPQESKGGTINIIKKTSKGSALSINS